ncbi:MAG: transposase, partial [Pseudomonadota bacterium]
HRVVISNSRLISADAETVAFRWKDYRIKRSDRMRIMRLDTHEFIRRFLIHVLPDRFHRIRHYGFLAGAKRKETVSKIRALLGAAAPSPPETEKGDARPALTLREPCPDCGGTLRIIETFRRGEVPRCRAPPRRRAA